MSRTLSYKPVSTNRLLWGIKEELMAECEAALIEEYEALMVEEYRRSGRRKRDSLWMQHRHLRNLFDDIEKTMDFKQ